MKKNCKLISVLLSCIMLMLIAVPCAAAASDKCTCSHSPIIYVIGRTTIYDDVNSESREEIPRGDDDTIAAAVKEALPYAAKAILLNQWDEYCAKALEVIEPFFSDYALDENGNVQNSSGVTFSWSESEMTDTHKKNDIYDYKFEYDSRLSPLEIADDLNDFIEAVKRVTGHDKVCLISRCVGTNYAMAYLVKYAKQNNYAGIDSCIFYNGSFNGFGLIEDAFSGNIKITDEGLYNYSETELDIGDDVINNFFHATVQLLKKNYGLILSAAAVNSFYKHIRTTLVPDILKISFGVTPGYWSMVNERFEEAKDYVFSSDGDKAYYSGIIKKIDDFHYGVQVNNKDTINEMIDSGVNVNIICKYGFAPIPVSESAVKISDGLIELERQSMGAVCSDFSGILSDKQLAGADEKYVSPDYQVDAASGILPEKTWYIKNLEHNPYPGCVNDLLYLLCYDKDMTVFSNEQYPQFLYYENSSIVPMTDENCNNSSLPGINTNIFRLMKNFLKAFIELIKMLFDKYQAAA